MQGLLRVQGAYKVLDTKRKGKHTHSNVEAMSRKRFVTRYPPLLNTRTLPRGDRRESNGNKYTSRPLFITSRPASSSNRYRKINRHYY